MYFCIILGYDSCCLLPELSCRRILHCTFYRYSSWICHHCPTAIKCISLRMRSKKGNKRPDHCQKYSSVFCSFFLSFFQKKLFLVNCFKFISVLSWFLSKYSLKFLTFTICPNPFTVKTFLDLSLSFTLACTKINLQTHA